MPDDTMRMQIGDTHFVTDLDLTSKLVALDRCLLLAPRSPELTNRAGSMSVGVLLTLIDVGASEPALASCRPDWTVTQDLSIHSTGWLTDGPAVIDLHVKRMGKKVVIVAADVYDARGESDIEVVEAAIDSGSGGLVRTAVSLLTFARIPGTAAAQMDAYDPSQWIGEVRHRSPDTPPIGPMHERLGLATVDAAAGVLEIDRSPYVVNSVGTINGGVQAVTIEAAAEAMSPGFVAVDQQLHYLSQLKVGPARTRTSLLRDAGDHRVVAVELVDAGHADQPVLTLSTVTLQRVTG